MGKGSNFDPEDLIKIFEFMGLIEPYFDSDEIGIEKRQLTDIKS